jgi:guanine deaminase
MDRERESPEYYIERTEESIPNTIKLIEYIRSLSPSKGAFCNPVPDPSEPHTKSSPDGTPYIYPVLTPRFAISTTERLIESLGKLAASDPSLAIQTHISENPAEVEHTKKLYRHLSTPGKPITYAGVYDHYGLLRDNTILAHAVHLEEEELELVKERGSGISHCPTSNFNLTSGMAKVGVMLDKSIKVGSFAS